MTRTEKTTSLIADYLEAMKTFSPLTTEIETVTLKALRLNARPVEDEMTQGEVADAIGVDASTISRWEKGQVKGIKHYQIWLLSLFFQKELLEIHAAIKNTEEVFAKKLPELRDTN